MSLPSNKSQTLDPWQVWFFRLVQIAGLALAVWEARPNAMERPWLLLIALAMMFGALGIEITLRAVLRIMGDKP